MAKNNVWYLDTDGTTANTNLGFEARRLQTQAARNDGRGGAYICIFMQHECIRAMTQLYESK